MTTMTEAPTYAPTSAPLAGRREWIGLSVLSLACLLYVMDLTVLHLAVPARTPATGPSGTCRAQRLPDERER